MSVISLVIDILIGILCLVIVIKNAARGFIKSLMVLARTVLAVLIAVVFNAPIARLFGQAFFNNWAQGVSHDAFFATKIAEDQYRVCDVFNGVPKFATNFALNHSGVDQEMLQKYFTECNPATEADTAFIATGVGNALSYVISVALAFIVLFIVVEIIFAIIGVFLNKLAKVPMLKSVNIILGGAIGAIFAITLAWLISKGVQWVFQFGQNYYPDVFQQKIIEDTYIVEFFLEHDLWQWVKEHLAISF